MLNYLVYNEQARFLEIDPVHFYRSGVSAISFGLLIHTASGTGGGSGIRFLNRLGLDSNAAIRTLGRSVWMRSAKP